MLSRVITAASTSFRIGTALVVLLTVAACGATEEDEDDSGITEPARCEGATDRFWPDTADCDPACYTLVEGLIYDEERACYGQSPALTTPLACLRDGLSGASLSCVDVPELGKVMTTHVYFDIYEGFGSCQFELPQGFPCSN